MTELRDLRTGKRKPKGHMEGLRVRWSSATAIVVEAGSCRDSADAADMTLAAEVTPSIATLNAIQGLDEKTATATATTHGTATFEPSASLYVETPLSSTVRSLTGTISSVGTAVTGVGTKFKSELNVGDVIRSSANGASRVTAIASDTACTLVAAFPGGNVTGVAATVYENLTIWPDTATAGDQRRVNTISHAGTSVVVSSALTSNGAGKTIKIGVELVSCWYYVWLVSGGSGTGAILSTQRTTPYGVTGYTTAKRRIFSVRNNSAGDINTFVVTQRGPNVEVMWYGDLSAGGHFNIVSGGTATTNTAVSVDVGAPPTALAVYLHAELYDTRPNPMTELQQLVVRSSFDTSVSNFAFTVFADTQTGADGYGGSAAGWVPLDGSRQIVNWNLVGVDTNTPSYIGVAGYRETL